ncbi:MAG: hypothetical protein HKN08_07210, partial [Gammaproteobacteria bacterium]|nr:hypothetical protein [Gammaproteobacteria bacterium]
MKWRNVILFIILASLSYTSGAQTVSERLQSIGGFLNRSAEQEFLHPDEAFLLSPTVASEDHINVNVIIAEGYYLYHDKFNFEIIEGTDRINNGGVSIPDGNVKQDPSFGEVEVNIGVIDIGVPVIRETSGETEITFQYGYQGCKDESLCYPPIKKTATLLLPETSGITRGSSIAGQTAGQGSSSMAVENIVSEQDSIT